VYPWWVKEATTGVPLLDGSGLNT